MEFEETRIVLKDGRTALLRRPRPDSDAAAMIAVLKRMCGETEFLLRYPEECRWTEAQERELLAASLQSDDRLMLVCEADGEIAGMCGFNRYPQLKFCHRADVDIALQRPFWGLGIGTAMFQAMIDVARKRGVSQMELNYIEGNERGRALYQKLGFIQVAEHPDAVRLRDGSLRKLIFMVKKL